MTAPVVAVFGSVNVDLVIGVRALPRPGETVLGDELVVAHGGKGANQAVAASRLGGRTRFAGAVGGDTYADELVEGLVADGVDVAGVRRVRGPSGVALIVVEESGENQIVVSAGANASARAADVDLVDAAVLVCQLEVPLEQVAVACETARAAGVLVVLNAAPVRPLPPSLLGWVDVLVVNETEARALAGGMGAVPLVAETLGPAGVRVLERGSERFRVPAPRVRSVDGVGAGDAFCGALAVGLASGGELEWTLRRACAAGALATTRLGARTALPTWEEVDALVDEGGAG